MIMYKRNAIFNDGPVTQIQDIPSISSLFFTMNVNQLRPFPSRFVLRDLTAVTEPVFKLRTNPHQEEAYRNIERWFKE